MRPSAHQVIKLFQIALAHADVRTEAYEAYVCFVRQLSVDDLARWLNTLVAVAMHGLAGAWPPPATVAVPPAAAHLVNYLFVHRRDVLKRHVRRLLLLRPGPGLVALQPLDAVLEEAEKDRGKQATPSLTPEAAAKVLQPILDGVGDANAVVCELALQVLAQFLRSHRSAVLALEADWAGEHGAVEPAAASVVQRLVAGVLDSGARFRGASSAVPALVAECLSYLGAQEPDLLYAAAAAASNGAPRSASGVGPAPARGAGRGGRAATTLVWPDPAGAGAAGKPSYAVADFWDLASVPSSKALAVHLIRTELLRANQSGDTADTQNTAAYAIQMLLRFLFSESPTEAATAATARLAALLQRPAAQLHADVDKLEKALLTHIANKKAADASTSNDARASWPADYWKHPVAIWALFAPPTREQLRPFAKHQLQLSYREAGADGALDTAIFTPTIDVEEWTSRWCLRLVDCARTLVCHTVFEACQGIMLKDHAVAQAILPYLVLVVALYGDEAAREGLLIEVRTVLEAAAAADISRAGTRSPGTATASDRAREGVAPGPAAAAAAAATTTTAAGPAAAAQIVFAALDFLAAWRQKRSPELAQMRVSELNSNKQAVAPQDSPTARTLAEQNRRVLKVLQAASNGVKAGAAYRCGQMERALQYFELHMRETRESSSRTLADGRWFVPAVPTVVVSTEQGDAEAEATPAAAAGPRPQASAQDVWTHLVAQLQSVYARLDEPDGIAGIGALFNAHPLEQQIVECRAAGQWSVALACYELAIQRRGGGGGGGGGEGRLPEHVYRYGVLDCLRNMGHYETMLMNVRGAAAAAARTDAAALDRLAAYGVQAAWRLGAWDALDEFLASTAQSHFEVRVGSLLATLRAGDGASHAALLETSRAALAEPLLSTALGQPSYDRAYPTMVRLHMLGDLALYCDGLQLWAGTSEAAGASPDHELERLRAVLDEWTKRLHTTQASYRAREPILSLHRVLIELYRYVASVSRRLLNRRAALR